MRVITARKLIGAVIAADSGDLDAEDLGVLGQTLQSVGSHAFEDEPGARRRGRARYGSSAPHPRPAIAPIRAPTCTAIPLHSSPRFSHSPMWTPARIGMPWVASAGTRSSRTAPPWSDRRTARRSRRRCAWRADRRTRQHRVDQPVVVVELSAPALVALRGQHFRRADDVGEQHGAQHPLGRRRIGLLANEFQDRLRKQLDEVDRIVFTRRQLAQFGVRYPGGQRSGGFERRNAVAPAGQDQRGRPDAVEHIRGHRSRSPPATSASPSSGSRTPAAPCRTSREHRARRRSARRTSAIAPSPQWFSMSSTPRRSVPA